MCALDYQRRVDTRKVEQCVHVVFLSAKRDANAVLSGCCDERDAVAMRQ